MLDDWDSEDGYSPTPEKGNEQRSRDGDEKGERPESLLSPSSLSDANKLSIRQVPQKDLLFQVETLERSAARGHGTVTSVAYATNYLLVGTDKGWLIRFHFQDMNSVVPPTDPSVEIDLNIARRGEQMVHRVFVDPSGRHVLATLHMALGGAETFYLHANWTKARVLPGLKGVLVNAVAWHRHQPSKTSTKDILVGSATGQVYELLVEERDKTEKYCRLRFALPEETREPFCSVQMEILGNAPNVRYFVMAATPTRLYTFEGKASFSLELTLANGPSRVTELPRGNLYNSELHFFGGKKRTDYFAWLAGPGILHGQLNLGGGGAQPTPDGPKEQQGQVHFLGRRGLLTYSTLDTEGEVAQPMAFVVSEYHFILAYSDRIKVVNFVSGELVEQHYLVGKAWGPGPLLGICGDPVQKLFYVFTQSSIYEVSVTNEDSRMWEVYLRLKDYKSALSLCGDSAQKKDQVYSAQAEEAFAAEKYDIAAVHYASITQSITFEEVALKFVSVGAQEALRIFLVYKLDKLDKNDRSQGTMVATWATELWLDKINALILEEAKEGTVEAAPLPAGEEAELEEEGEVSDVAAGANGRVRATVNDFKAFISDHKDKLDEATTMKLLGSYGREEELLHFATLKEKHDVVLQSYIRKGDALRALQVLPRLPPEMQYKFGAPLMLLDAALTVDAWIAAGTRLEPRRLIPALLRYADACPPGEAYEAIRYLEFSIQRLRREDSALYNLLLTLYAKQEDESALLRFLNDCEGSAAAAAADIAAGSGGLPPTPTRVRRSTGSSRGGGSPLDPKYALRICLGEGRLRSCVAIYSRLGMHEEAVALALQVDLDLAKSEADKAQDDPDLRKKLWLLIARHVIERSSPESLRDAAVGEGNGRRGVQRAESKDAANMRKAIAFLKETDGLLKVEDLLPLFPDFVLIDDFKEAICFSLKAYSEQIGELKREMEAATKSAESLRSDTGALSQRYALLDRKEACGICGKPLLQTSGREGGTLGAMSGGGGMAPFYVFPCEHAFHADCLTKYLMKHAEAPERDRIVTLTRRLEAATKDAARLQRSQGGADYEGGGDREGKAAAALVDKVRAEVDDAVAGECPFCGSLMIRSIALPFVDANEAGVQDWKIA
eukprot:TRINITY_DN23099_c0_g1_i1.p1 TRINITY_DN23099_c0_g1~~TRINITY_DN23099_c0_g1_i1.p1  ORF type:complete len:1123 (-),score=263.65 TRINITY_DN23099_c0_g1_i1:370-3738(-)